MGRIQGDSIGSLGVLVATYLGQATCIDSLDPSGLTGGYGSSVMDGPSADLRYADLISRFSR